MHRACFLDPPDRALLEQVFDKGVTPGDLAKAAGLHERSIQRRVRSLLRRLADPGVEYILRTHTEWPGELGDVALVLYVRGRSMRETADELNISLHKVRHYASVIDAIVDQGINGGRTRNTVKRFLATVDA